MKGRICRYVRDRRGVFKNNIQRINKHNDEGHGYQLGVNQFSDNGEYIID